MINRRDALKRIGGIAGAAGHFPELPVEQAQGGRRELPAKIARRGGGAQHAAGRVGADTA